MGMKVRVEEDAMLAFRVGRGEREEGGEISNWKSCLLLLPLLLLSSSTSVSHMLRFDSRRAEVLGEEAVPNLT